MQVIITAFCGLTYVRKNNSVMLAASIFTSRTTFLTLPGIWRQQAPPKHYQQYNSPHGVKFQKNGTFMNTSVRKSQMVHKLTSVVYFVRDFFSFRHVFIKNKEV
jgi:hypothetical protein